MVSKSILPLDGAVYAALVADLLLWFRQEARVLPWRVLGRNHEQPYQVWLSEIMLQQTTVATVQDYFQRFIERWPTLADLATAPLDEVLGQWQGLGYYTRARNLHRTAQLIMNQHGGLFPQTESALLALPGIGPYTATAIAAITANVAVLPVDGNIARVLARVYVLETPLPALLLELRRRVVSLQQTEGHYGDVAQAFMDLGARICVPRTPRCPQCPIQTHCQAFQQQRVDDLPRRLAKKQKPTRYAVAFYLVTKSGAIWIQQRPSTGLLALMMAVPSTDWQEQKEHLQDPQLPKAQWHRAGLVKHTFTHFHLQVEVQCAVLPRRVKLPNGKWYVQEKLADLALPTVMKKIIQCGQHWLDETNVLII